MATIIFNGKSYNSLEEMPENERKAYDQMMDIFADKNGNGIPDFMEGDMVQKVLAANSTSINISGVTYHNLDELPPELRQSVDKAFQVITKLGIIPGVPAELQMQTPQAGREPVVQSQPFVSREYAGSEPALPGSGGVDVWTFKAVAPGESILVLGNYPPSESESYEEEVRFSIVVE